MWLRRNSCASVVALLMVLSGAAAAQSGTNACIGCQVSLSDVLHLGSVSDAELLDDASVLAVDRRGRFLAGTGGGTVLVFSPDGKLQRQIGRRGQGPGE